MKDKIIPGWVYVLYFSALYGESKNKICVLTCIEPKLIFLLINTNPSKLKEEQPELSDYQVLIDVASHSTFLKHDSYIDCTDPYGYDIDLMIKQLETEPGRIKGPLSELVLNAVIKAIDNNLIPTRQIAWMLNGLKTKV